jgi:ribosomal protein S18 acetylase RimI-like enzyme
MTRPAEYRTALPDADAFFSLFETTGWNVKYAAAPGDLARAMDASWMVLSAYVDGLLVGFGRVVSDGTMHAVLFDVIVHPDHQGRGIGSEILTRLVGACREAGIRDIQLFAAHDKGSFYERHGFRARPENAPGMEFIDKCTA